MAPSVPLSSAPSSLLSTQSSPPPPPSLTEIKEKLPAHCFRSSLGHSLFFALRSVVFVTVLLHLYSIAFAHSVVAAILATPIYLFLQGTVFWGIFTLGHDCGHGSFSAYSRINFLVGSLLHSFILTPYQPWKLTHRRHHKNTGSIDNDEIFVPTRQSAVPPPHLNVFPKIVNMYFFGGLTWFLYLGLGFAPKNRLFYHYWPYYPTLRNSVPSVLLSHCFLAGMVALIYKAVCIYGAPWVALVYGGPLLVFATWLVVTTFLHHNERRTMHWYSGSQWSYVKGNLSSIDRSYGWLVDHLGHNIGTHQVHHLFPIIPHYHLLEATVAFRKAFPELAKRSDEPILSAFRQNADSFGRHMVIPDHVDHVVI